MPKTQREQLQEILGVGIPENAEFEIHIRASDTDGAKAAREAITSVSVKPIKGFQGAKRFTIGDKLLGDKLRDNSVVRPSW